MKAFLLCFLCSAVLYTFSSELNIIAGLSVISSNVDPVNFDKFKEGKFDINQIEFHNHRRAQHIAILMNLDFDRNVEANLLERLKDANNYIESIILHTKQAGIVSQYEEKLSNTWYIDYNEDKHKVEVHERKA